MPKLFYTSPPRRRNSQCCDIRIRNFFQKVLSIQILLSVSMPFLVLLTGVLVWTIIFSMVQLPLDKALEASMKYKAKSFDGEVETFANQSFSAHNMMNHSMFVFSHYNTGPFEMERDCQKLGRQWLSLLKNKLVLESVTFVDANLGGFCSLVEFDVDEGVEYLLFVRKHATASIQVWEISQHDYQIGRLHSDFQLIKDIPSRSSCWYREARAQPYERLFFRSNETLSLSPNLVNSMASSVSTVDGMVDGALQTTHNFTKVQLFLRNGIRDNFTRKFQMEKGELVFTSHGKMRSKRGDRLPWDSPKLDPIISSALTMISLNAPEFFRVTDLKANIPTRIMEFESGGEKFVIYVEVGLSAYRDTVTISGSIVHKKVLYGLCEYTSLFIGLTSFGALSVALIIAWLFSFCITQPIRTVAHQTKVLARMSNKPMKSVHVRRFHFREAKNMYDSLNQMKTVMHRFKLYLPDHVLRILVGRQTLAPFMTQQNLTITFTDIAKFSTFSEQLSPWELIDLMSTFYEITIRVVQEHKGWIIELLGDALFVVYGTQQTEKHELRALQACLKMDAVIRKQNRVWQQNNLPEIHVRHGISSGLTWNGCVGNNIRMQYTAIGMSVRVAKELESMGKLLCTTESSILLSEETVQALPPENSLLIRWVTPLYMHHRHVIQVYQLIGDERDVRWTEERLRALQSLCSASSRMRNAWKHREFRSLVRICKRLIEQWESDPSITTSLFYLMDVARAEMSRTIAERYVTVPPAVHAVPLSHDDVKRAARSAETPFTDSSVFANLTFDKANFWAQNAVACAQGHRPMEPLLSSSWHQEFANNAKELYSPISPVVFFTKRPFPTDDSTGSQIQDDALCCANNESRE